MTTRDISRRLDRLNTWPLDRLPTFDRLAAVIE
jgi:hypothetical protein